MTRLLIAYATVEGHTATIAHCMREGLEAGAHEVRLLEVRTGNEELPADVDAVIVGGSIHAGRHKKALVAFATANRRRLVELSGGFFTVCLGALDESDEGRAATAEYGRAFCDAVRRFVAEVMLGACFGRPLLHSPTKDAESLREHRLGMAPAGWTYAA